MSLCPLLSLFGNPRVCLALCRKEGKVPPNPHRHGELGQRCGGSSTHEWLYLRRATPASRQVGTYSGVQPPPKVDYCKQEQRLCSLESVHPHLQCFWCPRFACYLNPD